MRKILHQTYPLLFLFCGLLTACARPGGRLSASTHLPVALQSGADPRVGTYVSNGRGFRTSSYWIEGPTGLILIDTQFLPSAAEEFVNWAEHTTGKKAVLAVILHPNPDKFNGTAVFQKRGIRVITSQPIVDLIPSVHRLRTEWFYDTFKPDYPQATPQPESFGATSTTIDAAGLRLQLHVLGPGCSATHVVAQFEDHVFVGDLVTQGFHSWLELGQLQPWLARLREIRALRPQIIHTGRGGSGGPELLQHQEAYLQRVIQIVRRHHPRPGQELSEQKSQAIVGQILAAYPAYHYPRFVENGVEAVWEEQSQPRGPSRR